MNRIIKFRAWDKDQQKMIGWAELSGIYALFLNAPNDWVSNVMQFTGLKDKNGKDIFEGDLVQWNKATVWQIVWSDRKARFMVNGLEPLTAPKAKSWEVVGNIYENPELGAL